ncbi:MAG: ACT domain-containing protein [Halofilum sp. (in: g-proteobacteria)]|nr:ACT domain-containing protein [Halofilum sp. (in: g-proteobacteria)]
MTGETDPVRLLRDMAAVLTAGTWVFARLPPGAALPAGLEPLGRFREAEGETVIVERTAAERAALAFEFPCRRITLTIHSDLAAVGLLAAVARCLADAGIPANTVSAFHHRPRVRSRGRGRARARGIAAVRGVGAMRRAPARGGGSMP